MQITESLKKERIEYIDAMRGFTMILVVYSHICNYCLGDWGMGFNETFFLFRLPCFFFISGWLFERPERQWNSVTIKSVVKHKFMVQIVPTMIFLLLLAPPPLFFSRLGTTKGGYWFTFALFVFFFLYIISSRFCKKWGCLLAFIISVMAFCYDAYYNSYFSHLGLLPKALGFISFATWRYYLFFYIGTLVKQHFDVFIQWTNKPIVIASVIVGFGAISMMPHSENVPISYLFFAIGGMLGLTMIFTLFRLFYTHRFSQITHHSLEYVGTRTLDIYLLHFFLLPRFLLPYGEQLRTYHSTPLEFIVALMLTLVVLALCLVISRIIRLSPFLARYLFGVRGKA